jgi:hypothetical protein
MVISLLPASAQAFAPRSNPTIVLNNKVEQWLTQSLKRINKVKRPLNSVPQHYRCLTETLSGENAIWHLCSIMLPKKPDSELVKDSNPLVEAMFNYQMLHVEGYVVHVDMVSQHEVVFKLTPETIDALVEYHKDIYSVDVKANTWSWPEKESQLKKLQDEFVQAVNRYVFRTGVRALEGLEEEGAGELLDGRSDDVKYGIMGLFQPLLPPPPRIVDVVRPAPILPSTTTAGYWHPQVSHMVSGSIMAPVSGLSAPVEPWRVLPSTPSPTISACTEPPHTYWPTNSSTATAIDPSLQLPSPAPSYSQPVSSYSQQNAYVTCSEADYLSPPMSNASIATSMGGAVSSLPLPSMLAQSNVGCGTSAGGYNGFAWSFEQYATPIYASAV